MAFVLRGAVAFGAGRWTGSWVTGDSPTSLPFSYALQTPLGEQFEVVAAGEKRSFPVSSSWKGSFSYSPGSGKPAKSVGDTFSLELRPPEYEGAAIRAEGSGRNPVGQYVLVGALDAGSGVLQVERRYTESSKAAKARPRGPRPPRAPAGVDAAEAAEALRRSSGRPVKRPRRALDEDGSERADDDGGGAAGGSSAFESGGAAGEPGAAAAPRSATGDNLRAAGGSVSALGSGRARAAAAVGPAVGSSKGKKVAPKAGAWSAATVLGRDAGAAAGELYEGELLGGMPQGVGTCVYRNGLMYEGQWVSGRESGQGVISGSDDVVLYQGEVLDGLPHGTGAREEGGEGGECISSPPTPTPFLHRCPAQAPTTLGAATGTPASGGTGSSMERASTSLCLARRTTGRCVSPRA